MQRGEIHTELCEKGNHRIYVLSIREIFLSSIQSNVHFNTSSISETHKKINFLECFFSRVLKFWYLNKPIKSKNQSFLELGSLNLNTEPSQT